MRATQSRIAKGMESSTGTGTERAVCVGVAEGAGLAHDAGNLLAALGLYCDLLGLPGVLRAEHRHYADELRVLSVRSGTLLQRMVELAGGEKDRGRAGCVSGSSGLERRGRRIGEETLGAPALGSGSNEDWSGAGSREGSATGSTSLGAVVERCRGLLETMAGRGIVLSMEASVGDSLGVPAEAVERILTNLVKNAGAAMLGAGVIRVSVSRGRREGLLRGRAVLAVEDTGCGIAPAMKRVLEGPGVALRGGRGLGMRIVRELAEAWGAQVRIESQLGVGTRVEVGWEESGGEAAAPPVGPGWETARPSAGQGRAQPLTGDRGMAAGAWPRTGLERGHDPHSLAAESARRWARC